MGNVIIKGISKKVYLSANNYYGADLKVGVFDDDLGEYIVNDVPMTEIVEPVGDVTATLTADAVTGDKQLTVDDVTGISITDRVSVGSSVYRVTDLDTAANTLTLHRGLDADAATDDVITVVGNMGIFKINLFITKEGYFVLQAKDTKFGLQISDSVTTKGMSLEEMFETTNKEINENERIIRETSSFTILV